MTNEAMALADELDKVRQLVREHIGPTMDKVVKRAVAALRTAAQPANVKWDNRPSCSFPEMAQPAVTTGAEGQLRDPKDALSAFSVLKDQFPELFALPNTAGDVREAERSRFVVRKEKSDSLSGMEAWAECWSVIDAPDGPDAASAQWVGFFINQGSADAAMRALSTPTPAPAVTGDVRVEDIYACSKSTLIGFRDELTEQQIKFICDQVSRKVALSLSRPHCESPGGEA